jgi:hypothetical protein
MTVFIFIYLVYSSEKPIRGLNRLNTALDSRTLLEKEVISDCVREDISVTVLQHLRRQNFPAIWEDLSFSTQTETAGKAC